MKFTQQGDWLVSSPIYVGSVDQVAAAAACPHGTFIEESREVEGGRLMILDRCTKCVATRVRTTVAEGKP